jgi:hypothetical protein
MTPSTAAADASDELDLPLAALSRTPTALVEYSRFIGLLPDGGVPMGGAGGEADGGPVC